MKTTMSELTAVLPAEKTVTTQSGGLPLILTKKVEVTCDCCPDCGEYFDESVGVSPRLVEEIPDPQPPELTQYNRHCYQCDSCGTETVATHPDCPDEGQFGERHRSISTISVRSPPPLSEDR